MLNNEISQMAEEMALVVNEANLEFKQRIENINSETFSSLIFSQAGAANLTDSVSISTGALSAITSAFSTSAGKIGQ